MTFLVDTGAQHSVLTKTKGPNGTPLQVLTIRLEDEYKLLELKPHRWAKFRTGYKSILWPRQKLEGWDWPPIVVNMKSSATPISVKQYPLSEEAYRGIRPHIQRLLRLGILEPCTSAWNTPLLRQKAGYGRLQARTGSERSK